MRILFITDSDITGASFRYRVHQYIGILEAEALACEVVRARAMPIRSLRRLREYDVVFVQKKLFSVPWILAASRCARRMIFDFDDAIWTCPKHDWSLPTRMKVRQRLRTMLSKSSCVTVGNGYLADYARKYNSNVVVIPTCLDTRYYRPAPRPRQSEQVRIGWMGSKPNLVYLEHLEPVFRRLSADAGVSLVVISNHEYRSRKLPTQFIPWTLDGELAALHGLDIGLMPLPDDDWTRGKCGFKTILYMACGIPSVSSRVGFNNELVLDGHNGFLAGDEQEWVDKISLLAHDPELRRRIGQEGRRTAEEKYSLEVGAALLVNTLRGVCSSR
ncbi:MAG TPA: glycosyltransferase family 4 protein [Armatimonadota bacterium]|nr:glycosyltransferase family 4 protein [Armatimonadota bacterium]